MRGTDKTGTVRHQKRNPGWKLIATKLVDIVHVSQSNQRGI